MVIVTLVTSYRDVKYVHQPFENEFGVTRNSNGTNYLTLVSPYQCIIHTSPFSRINYSEVKPTQLTLSTRGDKKTARRLTNKSSGHKEWEEKRSLPLF